MTILGLLLTVLMEELVVVMLTQVLPLLWVHLPTHYSTDTHLI